MVTTETCMSDKDSINRRNVLRKIGGIGVASAVGFSGLASGESLSDDEKQDVIDTIYKSQRVEQIKKKFGGVNIEPKKVQSVTTNQSGDLVTAKLSVSDGDLVYSSVKDTTVIVQFDRSASEIGESWPKNTEAFIKSTSSGVDLLRTATDEEIKDVTEGVNTSEIESADAVNIFIDPESQTYYMEKYDFNNKILEMFELATGGTSSGKISPTREDQNHEYNVREHKVFNSEKQNIQLQSDCNINSNTAADVILCFNQVGSCALCSPTLVGGPVPTVACLLVVCFGTPNAVSAILEEVDNSCFNLIKDVISCWDEWTSFW
jgi:hypothetical protein